MLILRLVIGLVEGEWWGGCQLIGGLDSCGRALSKNRLCLSNPVGTATGALCCSTLNGSEFKGARLWLVRPQIPLEKSAIQMHEHDG